MICEILLPLFLFSAGPQDWTTHNSAAGFTVRHPQGWVIETGAKGLVKIRSADQRSFAIVQPFLAPAGARAQQWIGGLPAPLNALLPQARIIAVRQVAGTQSDQAIAAMSGVRNGEPVRASALAWIYRRSGMLYVISAPAANYDALRPLLGTILASFSYRKPAGVGGGLSWMRIADPNEGAFSLEVPAGWKSSASLYRKDLTDSRTLIQTTSPDGEIVIRNGDADIPIFAVPNPALSSVGLREGSWYQPNKVMVRRYMPGADFAAEYVRTRVASRCSSLKFVAQQPRPDLDQRLLELFPNIHVAHGEVAFTCAMDGKQIAGWWMAGTVLINPNGPAGTWMVSTLAGYLTTEQKHPVTDAVFAHMGQSFRQNPRWIAQQRQIALAVAEEQARQSDRIMATLERNYWARDRMWDESTRKFVNQIANRVDLVDPQTGETYQAADGHNYYWVDPIGQRTGVASDLPFPPNVDFHELVEWKPPPAR